MTYTVTIFDQYQPVASLLESLARTAGSTLAFQDGRWLASWYESFAEAGIKPQIAVVSVGALSPDNVALALPLIRRKKYLLPLVEFADRGVTDYNFPFIGPSCPKIPAEMQQLFAALRKALRPYAVLRLQKMPRELNGFLNPFTMLSQVGPSQLTGYELELPKDSSRFLRDMGKKKRTEVERVGRALDQLGSHRFGIAESSAERAAVLEFIKQVQRDRVPLKGDRYVLEDEGYRQFYNRLVLDPGVSPISLISAIWLDGQPVAGLLGLLKNKRYIALRIAISPEADIARLGLGKVLLVHTAEWAIDAGCEVFDFSVGSSALKDWFHARPIELIEYVPALLRRPAERTEPTAQLLGMDPEHRTV